jgi:hypothetical protein
MARRSQVLQHLLAKLPDLLGLVELKKGIQIGCPFVFLVLYIDRGTILVGVGLPVRKGMGAFSKGPCCGCRSGMVSSQGIGAEAVHGVF